MSYEKRVAERPMRRYGEPAGCHTGRMKPPRAGWAGGAVCPEPKGVTAHPTAERLLEGFQELTLTIIREGRRRGYHPPLLSVMHPHMLTPLDFPMDIYTRRGADFRKPPRK